MNHPAHMTFAEVTQLEEKALRIATSLPPEQGDIIRLLVRVCTRQECMLSGIRGIVREVQ